MADPQLKTLRDHCHRQAAADLSRLAKARQHHRPTAEIKKRHDLWIQLRNEIDAYLNGTLEQTEHPDQLTIG